MVAKYNDIVEKHFDDARKEFESTFKVVKDGNPAATFVHAGETYQYVETVTGWYDSPLQAINAWRDIMQQYAGKQFLYWRKLLIDFNSNELDFETWKPNPNYLKWAIYSRFQVID